MIPITTSQSVLQVLFIFLQFFLFSFGTLSLSAPFIFSSMCRQTERMKEFWLNLKKHPVHFKIKNKTTSVFLTHQLSCTVGPLPWQPVPGRSGAWARHRAWRVAGGRVQDPILMSMREGCVPPKSWELKVAKKKVLDSRPTTQRSMSILDTNTLPVSCGMHYITCCCMLT